MKQDKKDMFGLRGKDENLALEGDFQIQTVSILKFSYFKALTFGLVLIMTIAGAILLYNIKKLRLFVFYISTPDLNSATHVYLKDVQGREAIEKITIVNGNRKQFCFLKLRYWINGSSDFWPVTFDPKSSKLPLNSILSDGLNSNQVKKQRQIYGFNEHTVDTPNYFLYMFSVIFTPLYLLQYFSVFILILQGKAMFGFLIVIISMITTSGNYIALYLSDKKIKKIAQRENLVKVLRQGQVETVNSKELVPGDVTIIQNAQMSYDALLIEGDAYMNEQSLTGQSVPVAKVPAKELHHEFSEKSILFEGTINTESVQNSKALVIATGFTTRKGKIQRQIMNRIPEQPDFFKTAVYFLGLSGVVSVILFFCILKIKLDSNIDRTLVWFGLINFVLTAIVPTLPIYFTTAYSLSIYRLKKNSILTTMPQKTVEPNRLKISCFDKTGTLTENNLVLNEVILYAVKSKNKQTLKKSKKLDELAQILFGTCHAVRKVGEQFLGDEVDLKMYEYSKFVKVSEPGEVYTGNNGERECEVLKVHQFQSKHQSMSVLVQERKSKKYYCFSKGAPQKMITFSRFQIKGYDELIAELALKGLRTIQFSFKEIRAHEVHMYLNSERQKFLQNSIPLGLVTFKNTLKVDTQETINELQEAGIDCKIITGDGIFIAVQTAVRAGIIPHQQPILVIEGKKQNDLKFIQAILLKKNTIGYEQQTIKIDLQDLSQINNYAIAIDSDFLQKNPPKNLIQKTKVFARVLPEGKSSIVQLLKQNLIENWESQPRFNKIFGNGRPKISMTGDGANDLLAIKSADVGIGISNSDASYGAGFTIKELSQICTVIKQGKCTSQNLIESVRYFLIVGYLNNAVDALCSTQSTTLSQTMTIYLSLVVSTILPIIAALSKPNPEKKLTKNIVQDNFLSLQSQLLTWGNIILLSFGLIVGFFYIRSTEDYVPNPKPYWVLAEGWNPHCQLVTAIFLLVGVPLISSIFIVYQSDPFKNHIYKNNLLLLFLAFNLLLMVLFYTFNSQLEGVFQTVILPGKTTLLILFLISLSSQAVAYIFTTLVSKKLQQTLQVQPQDNSEKTLLSENTIQSIFLN